MIQLPAWTTITTTEAVYANDPLSFLPAPPVMTSAATPINASAPMEFNFSPPDDTTQFFVFLYFAEIQKLQPNQSRAFQVLLNGKPWTNGLISPPYLEGIVSYSTAPLTGGTYDFSLVKTPDSTLPPFLNAVEIYRVIDFSQSPTDERDGKRRF